MEGWVVAAEDWVQDPGRGVDLVDGRLEVVPHRMIGGQMIGLLVIDPASVDGRHVHVRLGELCR